MDVSLSPNSQTLTLASIRRDFLGGNHNLRLNRTKSKCKKLAGLKLKSGGSNLVLNASLESEAIIVAVAIATLSVASFAYLNSSKKGKKASKPANPTNTLFVQDTGEKNIVIEDEKNLVQDYEHATPVVESNISLDRIIEERHTVEKSESQLAFQVSSFKQGENFLSEKLESPALVSFDFGHAVSSEKWEGAIPSFTSSGDSLVSGACLASEKTEEIIPSFTSSEVSKECMPALLTFAADMSLLQKKEETSEAIFHSESHTLSINSGLNNVSDPAASLPAELNGMKTLMPEVVNNLESTWQNVFPQDSTREDLYTFYQANQFLTSSLSNVNGLKKASSSCFRLNGITYSSLVNDTISSGEDLLTKHHNVAEGESHVVHAPENYPHRRKELANGNEGIPKGKDKKLPPLKNLPLHSPNEMHATEKDCTEKHLRNYNRLLRQGRFIDCINILEDMERNGLLDMNKVYHSRYFDTCKHQKAVNEAFRFTKLIPNPTLSTFNMLMSVCASSQDSESAFQVMQLVREAGLKADCKLYTTLISTCAKSGKVDSMFEVFHKMVNAKVEPNVHTYGALIDGCARAAQVAKAFGAYGIMRSKNVKPDRVVFNALITACGQSGAVDRAFDVVAEMMAETQPIDPDHVTVGALIKACVNAGKVDQAKEVYKMVHKYNIKGTPDLYTIAINSCSQSGDWEFACTVYNDLRSKGIVPDEMFLSAMIDVAGHARKLDAAFEVLQEAKISGIQLGIISYSSLMGACCNAKDWEKALELYEEIKFMKLKPTVSTMNALITALCDGDQLDKAIDAFSEMKRIGLRPNSITYSILLVACKREDDLDVGIKLLSQAKEDDVAPNLSMCRCLIRMCLRRFKKAATLGEPVASFNSGRPQVENKWTSLALMVYRETITAGEVPSVEVFSQVLGCLQLPLDVSLRNRIFENVGVSSESSKLSKLCPLVDGFGEYDPRAFSLLEEAASLEIVPCISLKRSPITVDTTNLPVNAAEVYLLTVLKGLKHRLAAGAKLPSINVLLSVDKTEVSSNNGEKTINVAARVSQKIGAMLRRLGLPYQGNESYGKIRINGLALKRWLQPRLSSPFSGKPADFGLSQFRLGKGISHQQRDIRIGNFSVEKKGNDTDISW